MKGTKIVESEKGKIISKTRPKAPFRPSHRVKGLREKKGLRVGRGRGNDRNRMC